MTLNTEIAASIIIPVYNKEDSLQKCFDSLSKQEGEELFEAIFIDDGSTDSSLELCRAFSKRHSWARVIAQENQGVSSARNTGIDNAKGRYLVFLDADDRLSDGAVQKLISFFDSHFDDVDVVSYPIVYVNPSNGKQSRHQREKWLSESGTYALADYPYVAQTTMNVCVKNRFADNIHFKTGMKMGEDQLYITNNLARKGVLGACNDARYYYTRDGSGLSSKRNNPLYAYEDMITLFSHLRNMAENTPHMAEYLYQMILYNVAWRIKSDMLLPVYLTGHEYDAGKGRLFDIISSIPFSSIADSPFMNNYHKGYVFKALCNLPALTSVNFDGQDCELNFGGSIWKVQCPSVIIARFMNRGTFYLVEGRVISPAFLFMDKPRLALATDGVSTECDLYPSSFDYSGAKVQTAKCWTFRLQLPTGRSETLSFNLIVGNTLTDNVRIVLKDVKRFNARKEGGRLYFKDDVVSVCGNAIEIRQKTLSDSFKSFARGMKRDKAMWAKRLALRLFSWRNRGRQIWLYSDLPSSHLEGNALIQMKHDLKQNDGVIRYYVTEDVEWFRQNNPDIAHNVVRRGSKRHFILSLSAHVLMASYLERFTYLPFRKRTYSGLGDLVGSQWYVYLQHGVLHAHLPWYYSYDRILFDKEVISSEFEKQNLLENYAFPLEALIPSGMPRLDCLEMRGKSRRILYAPSWRNYLVAGNGKRRIAADETLLSSSFYKGMCELLKSEKLKTLLKTYGYELDVKLHPNFKCYEHLIDVDSDNIHCVQGEINENDYGIVITDFSSYVFDFVYRGCDVVYFMPDALEFRAGLNHYRELDLPLEKGFGPYCESPDKVIDALEAAINQDVARSVSNEDGAIPASSQSHEFFLYHDGRNCDRLYEALKKLD